MGLNLKKVILRSKRSLALNSCTTSRGSMENLYDGKYDRKETKDLSTNQHWLQRQESKSRRKAVAEDKLRQDLEELEYNMRGKAIEKYELFP